MNTYSKPDPTTKYTEASAEYRELEAQLGAIGTRVKEVNDAITALKNSPSTKGLGALERELRELKAQGEVVNAQRHGNPGAPKIRISYLKAMLLFGLEQAQTVKFEAALDEFVKQVRDRGVQTYRLEELAKRDARRNIARRTLYVYETGEDKSFSTLMQTLKQVMQSIREHAINDLDARSILEDKATIEATQWGDYFQMDDLADGEWFYISGAVRGEDNEMFDWDA